MKGERELNSYASATLPGRKPLSMRPGKQRAEPSASRLLHRNPETQSFELTSADHGNGAFVSSSRLTRDPSTQFRFTGGTGANDEAERYARGSVNLHRSIQ